MEDLKVSKTELSAKITRKLNFHFNDRIYRNLVELNADIANVKNKKDKKTKAPLKKDQEPSIEDFCHDEKEDDLPPNIPLTKCKFKPIRSVESGQLHKLLASFEKL
uniref:Protein phosphatase 1 regulatory subunit 35 C-terminal domain-containing protein n=1 Tax=Pararge aegeria TaxID=116150 RepID=S4PRK7_9NEOP